MKLAVPFIQLPLRFDAQRLAAEIAALPGDAWRPHPQGYAGNSMLPLVAVGGDPENEAFAGVMAPTPALTSCPYLQDVFSALAATIGRSRLMRLSGQAEVTRHVDQGYYWTERVRVHVPILTQPTVRFECGHEAIHMAAGECWIFDTWRQHRVVNDAEQERIHLVVDTVGSGRFWDLVAAGRPPSAPPTAWAPRQIEPGHGPRDFACERVNVPRVMSPWEMSTHFGFLFNEARPHRNLAALQGCVARLLRTWQGLWFEHGPDVADRSPYTAALDSFVADARPLAADVVLLNDIRWMSAVMTIIARYAAGAHESAGGRTMA